MEKVIYSTQANSGFVDGTLEIYSDRLILIGKKKTIEYKFIDMTSASHSMGCLNVTLKNGKTDVFNISDKKLRLEIIDYINNQLTNVKVNNQIENNDINTKNTKVETNNIEKNNERENTSNDKQNNNVAKIIGAIVSIIIFIVIIGNVFGTDTTIEGGDDAVFYALREIPESILTFDDVMSNELKCEAKEKTDDEIILVQCTTTNQDVIDHYDSETIWYGYQETADGRSHYRSINKSKDKVLENMRK